MKNKIRVLNYSIYKCFYNFIINFLPDDLISNCYLRPFFARCFGLKYKGKCFIRKNIYYIYPDRISFGENVYIGRDAYLDAPGRITFGNNVRIGYQVTFISATHDIGPSDMREGPMLLKPIVIEDGCWIGARVVIGPGVTVGKGSIITAGSVVMRSIPPNSFVAGNPARPIQKLDCF